MSPVATYSNINCDSKILHHESTKINEKTSIDKGDRKKIIILGDSLPNGISEKDFSKKQLKNH